MSLNEKSFEKIVGKGENAGNQHFLFFPQCFLPLPKTSIEFLFKCIMSSANALNLDQSKICRLVKSYGEIIRNTKELALYHTIPKFFLVEKVFLKKRVQKKLKFW